MSRKQGLTRSSDQEQNESHAGWKRTRAHGANGSSPGSRRCRASEGSVEGSHANRSPGFYQLDRFSQTNGDTPTPDRKSLLDACGRKAPPLLLFNRVIRSLHRPRGSPWREGSMERTHANRAQGLHWLDGLSQATGSTPTPDRESLLDARGRQAPPLMSVRKYQVSSFQVPELGARSGRPSWNLVPGT
jgi:hypothetical protein